MYALVPRGHNLFVHEDQELQLLARPDFVNMHRIFVLYSQPIRFVRFDQKFENQDLTGVVPSLCF